MSFKNKLVFITMALMVLMMVVAIAISTLIIRKQNITASHNSLKKTFSIVQSILKSYQNELRSVSDQVIAAGDIDDTIHYLNLYKHKPTQSFIEAEYKKIIEHLYNAAITNNIHFFAIYDGDMDLVASVRVETDQSVFGFPHRFAEKKIYQLGVLKTGRSMENAEWKGSPTLPFVQTELPRNSTDQTDIGFEAVEGHVCVITHTPVMGEIFDHLKEKSVTKKAGFLIAVRKLDQPFVNQIKLYTGAEINIYTHDKLSTGTFQSYQEFETKQVGKTESGILDKKAGIFIEDVSVKGTAYDQGVLLLKNNGRTIGAVVALFSRNIARSNTIQIIKALGVAALICLFIAILLIYPFLRSFTQPISRIVESANLLAQGDFSKEITIYQRDEIGMLADAFRKMKNYFHKMADIFIEIAQGNLSHTVQPRSSNDILGVAFVNMSGYLNDLAEAATRIANGDLNHGIIPKSEADVLGHAFHTMASRLDENMKALANSEEKYRNIFENAIEGIFQTKPEGNFISANMSMAKLFGYNSSNNLINSVTDIANQCYANPEDRKLISGLLHDKRDISGMEIQLKRKDGTLFWGAVSIRSVRDSVGRLQYYEGSVVDLTESKEKIRAERARESAEKEREIAEMATRAKSEFLANMSHDIRTPMNAIIGLSHLALQTQLTPRQKDYLQKIYTSADLLLRLINDILDFSKIEAGKISMERRIFSLANVLDHLSSIIEKKSFEKGLTFSFWISESIPSYLEGDELRLVQVLVNLVSNAEKFTLKGSISITVALVEDSDREVTLSFNVRDTGIGMRREQIDQLFHPFQQADVSISRQYGGTGLGLTISRRLIEMMGGEIQIDSTPGTGTRVNFTARFGKSDGKPSARADSISKGRAKELLSGSHVLLVEDNDLNQQVAQELLEHAGIKSTVAENGLIALQLVKNEQFDGILMDLHMPVMDGLAAAREIRKMIPQSDVPIIAMTANAMTGDRESCLEAGMNDHIPKPIKPSNLYETLIRWLRPDITERSAKGSGTPATVDYTGSDDDLPQLDGVDVRAGLHHVNGDRAFYLKVLDDMHTRYRDIVGQIRTELNRDDFAAAERLAHTFKGLVGTLGADDLYNISAELEKVFHNREVDHIPELMDAFSRKVNGLMSDLKSSLKKNPEGINENGQLPSTDVLDRDTLRNRIENLFRYLEEADPEALEMIPEIRHLVSPAGIGIAKEIEKLQYLIEAYEFDAARQTVQGIAGAIGLTV